VKQHALQTLQQCSLRHEGAGTGGGGVGAGYCPHGGGGGVGYREQDDGLNLKVAASSRQSPPPPRRGAVVGGGIAAPSAVRPCLEILHLTEIWE
jgi:hypothetical protein